MSMQDKIKLLRQLTQAPMMDCKKGLEMHGGDIDKTTQWLKEKGLLIANKLKGREAKNGCVGVSVKNTFDWKKGNEQGRYSSYGALIELRTETDFAAKEKQFKETAQFIANHVLNKFHDTMQNKPLVANSGSRVLDTTALGDLSNDAIIQGKIQDLTRAFRENISLAPSIKIIGSNAIIGSYIHSTESGNRMGSLVGLEWKQPLADSIALPAEKQQILSKLADQIALQVIGGRPLFANRDKIPADALKKEREAILSDPAFAPTATKKIPADKIPKIVEAKLEKFFSEVVLSDQQFLLAQPQETKGKQQQQNRIKDLLEKTTKDLYPQLICDSFTVLEVGVEASN